MIRAATHEDVEAITSCVQAAYEHYIERMGQPPGPMLANYSRLVEENIVFVYNGTTSSIVGVLVMKIDNIALMDTVAVCPQAQGQGIGKQLIDYAESTASMLGHSSLHLYTHELMIENIAMYKKLDYLESRRITESGFNRVYMVKQLR